MPKSGNTVEIRPCEFEVMPDELMERSSGDPVVAGFFYSLSTALGGKTVDNQFLKACVAVKL